MFISYSSKDRELAARLAREIEATGRTVWWDPEIRAGENYRDVIIRELEAAKAVLVIWTKHSVISEWVISEASRAMRRPRDRYVAVRAPGLDEHDIPPPFDVRHTVDLSASTSVLAALAANIGRGESGDKDYPRQQLPVAPRPFSGASQLLDPRDFDALLSGLESLRCEPSAILARAAAAPLQQKSIDKLKNRLTHFDAVHKNAKDVDPELITAELRAIELSAYATVAAELAKAKTASATWQDHRVGQIWPRGLMGSWWFTDPDTKVQLRKSSDSSAICFGTIKFKAGDGNAYPSVGAFYEYAGILREDEPHAIGHIEIDYRVNGDYCQRSRIGYKGQLSPEGPDGFGACDQFNEYDRYPDDAEISLGVFKAGRVGQPISVLKCNGFTVRRQEKVPGRQAIERVLPDVAEGEYAYDKFREGIDRFFATWL